MLVRVLRFGGIVTENIDEEGVMRETFQSVLKKE